MFLLCLISLLAWQSHGYRCPIGKMECKCTNDSFSLVRSINCSGAGLTEFPVIPHTVRSLDLGYNSIGILRRNENKIYPGLITLNLEFNRISVIDDGYFYEFPQLKSLILRGNKLKAVPSTNTSANSFILDMSKNEVEVVTQFSGNSISALYLDFNKIQEIKDYDFSNLYNLRYLSLRSNKISRFSNNSLIPGVTHLSLGYNTLYEIPKLAVVQSTLQSMALEYNKIEDIDNIFFYPNLQNCTLVGNRISKLSSKGEHSSLEILYLRNNRIDYIVDNFMRRLPRLKLLDLSENSIEYIPERCFTPLQSLEILELSHNVIKEVAFNSLKNVNNLTILNLRNNKLKSFTPSLWYMPSIQSIDLTSNQLSDVPYITSTLLILHMANNRITDLMTRYFKDATSLLELDLSFNLISYIKTSVFEHTPKLKQLYLQGNKIPSVRSVSLVSNHHLETLNIGMNKIEEIPAKFFAKTSIKSLTLSYNKLTKLANDTLAPLDGSLTYLDISFNEDLEELSEVGLSKVTFLNLNGCIKLTSSKLPRVGLHNLQKILVPFSVMCCWFKKIKKDSVAKYKEHGRNPNVKVLDRQWNDDNDPAIKATYITPVQEGSIQSTMSPLTTKGYESLSTHSNAFMATHNTNPTSFPPTYSISKRKGYQHKRDAVHSTSAPADYISSFTPQVVELDFEEIVKKVGENATTVKVVVMEDESLHCTPEPDAFNPCEDLIGNWVLRLGVWMVCSLAVVGNLVLFSVTLFSTKKFTPTRFLVLNLSFSDLLTGVYLMMLAVVDAMSYGVYENYAMSWQNGPGCKVAGFLVTFSSELSVFTLTIISVERMVTIIYFSDPYKHLKTRHIALAMFVGWIICATSGLLPIFGVSDYSLVAICLPMKAHDMSDFGLIMSLLAVNTLAASLIIYSYLTIFSNVRHLQKPLDNADFRETLRMALIILTDIICWVPIVVCGVSAAFGRSLITTSNAKILVVFFLPLNACANPFLYSLSRPAFKKDLLFILSKFGLCTQRYYVVSRRKSGVDVDTRRKLPVKENRKTSHDSTATGSSGYSSECNFPKNRQSTGGLLRSGS